VAGPPIWPGGARPSFRNPSTEILIPVAAAGPYNNCGVAGAKANLLSPTYGSAAGLL
jgi:hypothetical protein